MSNTSPSGQRKPAAWHALRATLLILSLIAALVAVGAGGVVVAQRYASLHHVTISQPPVVGVAQVVTIVESVAPYQQMPRRALTTPAKPCACSATHQTVTIIPDAPAISSIGQTVVVSIAKQWLWAYQDGQLVLSTPVTTGMPQLPTPTGTFHIMMKESNVWFYSPWPQGSPYYYSPEFVQYAMLFLEGGFYLHSAAWRHAFGPGTNVPHTDPDGTQETGSHGCVNLPVDAAGALYRWIGIGATVTITA